MNPVTLIKSLITHKTLVWRLALTQLRAQYASTTFGAVWAVVQPAATVAVYWFVFTYGIRMPASTGGPPFFLTLIVAMSAWFFFADAINTGLSAISGNGYMLKKIAFPAEILPAVPIVNALLVHLCVLAIVVVLVPLNGVALSWNVLWVFYYIAALAILAVGFTYLLASLTVFQRDWAQFAGLVLQLWFWLTPIVWSPALFPPGVRAVLAFNPLFYVVQGYRAALLNGDVATPASAVSFWCVSVVVLCLGSAVFGRLRPDFADVL